MPLVVEGISQGIRTEPAKEFGKPPKVLAGIGFPKNNGFADQLEVVEITLSQEQVAADFIGKFNALKGKDCRVEVSIRNNAFNGKAYTSYYANGEPVALAQTAKPALKAAS